MAAESLVWQESDTRALAGLAGWEDLETLAGLEGLGDLEGVVGQENLEGLAYAENIEEMAVQEVGRSRKSGGCGMSLAGPRVSGETGHWTTWRIANSESESRRDVADLRGGVSESGSFQRWIHGES